MIIVTKKTNKIEVIDWLTISMTANRLLSLKGFLIPRSFFMSSREREKQNITIIKSMNHQDRDYCTSHWPQRFGKEKKIAWFNWIQ